MALIDDVKAVLEDLKAKGWNTVFAAHGVDLEDVLNQHDLKAALTGTTYPVGRGQTGFHDFSVDQAHLIEPGDPARSLLYHAMASPLVTLPDDPDPAAADRYPALRQIDVIENFIYDCMPLTAATLRGATIAVFAYQYRERERTAHGQHADMIYSRCGIARNGPVEPLFDKRARSFVPHGVAEGGTDGKLQARVMPARYGAFLCLSRSGERNWTARRKTGSFALTGGRRKGDRKRGFLVPYRKLFDAQVLIDDTVISVAFTDYHLNEKLRRAGLIDDGARFPPDFDLDKPPFKIESCNGNGFIGWKKHPGSLVLEPTNRPLIEPAKQEDETTKKTRIVRFEVDRQGWPPRRNRRYTSFAISSGTLNLIREGFESLLDGFLDWIGHEQRFPRPRNAPEFMNIRHRLKGENEDAVADGSDPEILDMRKEPCNRGEFLKAVERPTWKAVAFLDGCADGYVGATIDLSDGTQRDAKRAYSVIAPPDFFPYVDQLEIDRWFRVSNFNADTQFKQGGPDPLCFGRLTPIPHLRAKDDAFDSFDRADQTMTAMVSDPPRRIGKNPAEAHRPLTTTFLPDASSNVFAPGWDVTYSSDHEGIFYATYGLGSPFPEDVKLCAAANAFWPAVSPDASRTFGRSDTPTAIPLMDCELGHCPQHPRAKLEPEHLKAGWDGERGPYIADGGKHLNVADIERSDYVANTLDGTLEVAALAHLTSAEIIERMAALRAAVAVVDRGKTPAETDQTVISARVVDWDTEPDKPAEMTGPGFRFLFAELDDLDDAEPDRENPRRVLLQIKSDVVRCDVAGPDAALVRVTAKVEPGGRARQLY